MAYGKKLNLNFHRSKSRNQINFEKLKVFDTNTQIKSKENIKALIGLNGS